MADKTFPIKLIYEDGETDTFNVSSSLNVKNIKELISLRPSFSQSSSTKNLSEGEFNISTSGNMNDLITMEGSSLAIANVECRNAIRNGVPIPIYILSEQKRTIATRERGLQPVTNRNFTYKPTKSTDFLGNMNRHNLSFELNSTMAHGSNNNNNWKDNFSAWQKSLPKPPKSQSIPSCEDLFEEKKDSNKISIPQSEPSPPPKVPEQSADLIEPAPININQPFYWISMISPNGMVTKLKCMANFNKKEFIKDAIAQFQNAIDNLLKGDLSVVEPDGSPYGKRRDLEDGVELLTDQYINKCVLHQQVPMLCNFPFIPALSRTLSDQSPHMALANLKRATTSPQRLTGFIFEAQSSFYELNKSKQGIFESIVTANKLSEYLSRSKKEQEISHYRENIIPIASSIQQKAKLDIPFTRITLINWAITNLPNSFTITFIFSGNITRSLVCFENTLVGDMIFTLVQSFQSQTSSAILKSPNDYILKFNNRNEFIHPKMTFGMLTRVREYLKKSIPIQIYLKDISEIIEKYGAITEPNEEYMLKNDGDIFSSHLNNDNDNNQPNTMMITDLDYNFQVRLISVGMKTAFNTPISNSEAYQIEVHLYHGNALLCSPMWTKAHPSTKFNEWIGTSSVKISNIPRATKVCFTLYIKKFKELTPLGCVNFQFFDFLGCLRYGTFKLPLWPNSKANPLGTCSLNMEMENRLFINVEFPSYCDKIVRFPSYRQLIYSQQANPRSQDQNINMLNSKLGALINTDPLYKMSTTEKSYVWSSRQILLGFPNALPKVLHCVDWTSSKMTTEALRLLPFWATLSPTEALQLLDFHFVVPEVREFAINCLRKISDIELSDYLLQLVQVIKYEPYHDSPLSRFLLQRAIQNRSRIGHPFFWHLKAELNIPDTSERYMLLLEAYVYGCGDHSFELMKQNELAISLHTISESVKQSKKKLRLGLLQKELSEIRVPYALGLPISASYHVSNIVVEKCKYMDSFTVPLWIVFASPEGEHIPIIFKSGDDLRADILTLQMFRIMDKLWQSSGLDLQITPYLCAATDEGAGMIEVVQNARTAAAIQKEAFGVAGALKKTPLAKWLREQNNSDFEYEKVVDNFIHSLAGYCVATYVLGIGDRHNDNIMIAKSGHLFHIDFAHFLGNVQMFSGIKRERAPFVLTPEFLYVMITSAPKDRKNHPNFQKFVNLCCEAFNILRRNAHLFITLFSMMLSTGIPELKCDDDIAYLRNAFALDRTEEDARKLFEDLIDESLNTKATTVNFVIHNIAHANT